MDYEIIDNVLDKETFNTLKNLMMSENFPWFHISDHVAYPGDNSKYSYFIHKFFHFTSKPPIYPSYELILPIFDVIKPFSLIKAKANLFTKTDNIYEFPMHGDQDFKHKGAIFYINTNNGYTKLYDGTKIESVENRLFLFDSSQLHCSSTCSDQLSRVNININYF